MIYLAYIILGTVYTLQHEYYYFYRLFVYVSGRHRNESKYEKLIVTMRATRLQLSFTPINIHIYV